MHIIISSIVFHVRWSQKFPDITLDLVRYLYLLIIIIPFLSKLWHIKRVARYLIRTGSNLMHFIISSIICHVRWYQMFFKYHVLFQQLLVPFDYQYHISFFMTIIAHIKQVARFLFCTRRNVMRLLMSNHKGKIVSNFTDK